MYLHTEQHIIYTMQPVCMSWTLALSKSWACVLCLSGFALQDNHFVSYKQCIHAPTMIYSSSIKVWNVIFEAYSLLTYFHYFSCKSACINVWSEGNLYQWHSQKKYNLKLLSTYSQVNLLKSSYPCQNTSC